MDYYDEEILMKKKAIERENHKTLETGIYVDDELIEFKETELEDLKMSVFLPENFVIMPEELKVIKYPSLNAPDVLFTSHDTTVNIGFSLLSVNLDEGETSSISNKFQTVIRNLNPTIVIKTSEKTETTSGREMSWFDFKGYSMDGQSYNRLAFVKMNGYAIHGIFNCFEQESMKWIPIIEQIFLAIK